MLLPFAISMVLCSLHTALTALMACYLAVIFSVMRQ